ncbi:hypothetical protein EF384_02075 [Aerococcus agrisoli]|uniref:MFS transporter n=1 Tax=Aerococcus agrisoli TaxID=2487350 RepID=A0A3N4GP53_9LACT|nr:MFS transporter [Aerococcus agrisoli]RPA62426.1 hypothetical protein EF384_02075 [Aerococcus agrisoli]
MKKEFIKYYWLVFNAVLITAFFNPILYLFLLRTYTMSIIGLYLSIFWFTSFLTEIMCGAITDRIGEKYALILSGIFRILGLIFLIQGNIGLLYLSAVCSGISESFYSGSLSSWIINRANLLKIDMNTEKLFSRASLIGLCTSLVVGSLSIYYLYPFSTQLPFYLSIFATLIFIVSAFSLNGRHQMETSDMKTFVKKTYKETINTFKQLFSVKTGFLMMCFLLLPEILDVGPSNQWQAVFSSIENNQNVLSVLWIVITVSGLFGSLISSKVLRKAKDIDAFSILITIDCILILIICLVPAIWIKVLSFGLHVMMNTITNIKADVILHANIVKSDAGRNTTVSTYYSFQSVFISFMLVINGFSSEKLGIIETWIVTLVVVFFLLIILRFYLDRQKQFYHDEI